MTLDVRWYVVTGRALVDVSAVARHVDEVEALAKRSRHVHVAGLRHCLTRTITASLDTSIINGKIID